MARIILFLIGLNCISICFGDNLQRENWIMEACSIGDKLIDSIYSEIPQRELQGIEYITPTYKFVCDEMPDSIERLRIIHSQPLDKYSKPFGLNRSIVIMYLKNGGKQRIFSGQHDIQNPFLSNFLLLQEEMITNIWHKIDFSRLNLSWQPDYESYFYILYYDFIHR